MREDRNKIYLPTGLTGNLMPKEGEKKKKRKMCLEIRKRKVLRDRDSGKKKRGCEIGSA